MKVIIKKNVVLTELMLKLEAGRLRGNFITVYKCLIYIGEGGGGLPTDGTRAVGRNKSPMKFHGQKKKLFLS